MTEGKSSSFVTDMIAGVISGGVASLITYPFERSITLLQVQGVNPKLGAPARPFAGGFFGFADVLRQTAAGPGWAANYRGVVMKILGPSCVMKPLNFALNDACQGIFGSYDPKTDRGRYGMAAFASGALAGLLATPVGCLVAWPVTRAQADLRPDGARLTAGGHLGHMAARPAGTASLVARAVPVAAAGQMLFRGTYFGVNDTLRACNPYQKDKGLFGLASKFAVAQVAALGASTVTYPISVVVNRWVCANYEATETLRGAVRAAMDDRGVAGLYRGYASKLTTTVASGLALLLYGELKGLMVR